MGRAAAWALLFCGSSKTIGFLGWWYRFQSPATIANFEGTLSREIVDLYHNSQFLMVPVMLNKKDRRPFVLDTVFASPP
jgi:hypothetical protein